jgi:hypothetical protein
VGGQGRRRCESGGKSADGNANACPESHNPSDARYSTLEPRFTRGSALASSPSLLQPPGRLTLGTPRSAFGSKVGLDPSHVQHVELALDVGARRDRMQRAGYLSLSVYALSNDEPTARDAGGERVIDRRTEGRCSAEHRDSYCRHAEILAPAAGAEPTSSPSRRRILGAANRSPEGSRFGFDLLARAAACLIRPSSSA